MRFSEFSPTVQELWAMFALLRGVGFSSDDLHLVLDVPPLDGQGCVGIAVAVTGAPIVVVSVPRLESAAEVKAGWLRLAEVIDQIPEQDLADVWLGSIARAEAPKVLFTLVSGGIRLPKAPTTDNVQVFPAPKGEA